MLVEDTVMEGLKVIRPKVYGDDRGYFLESYRKDVLQEQGFNVAFVQENQSKSKFGVIRGLHYQRGKHAQGKLIRSIYGRILDVVVDIRIESPTYGQVFSIELDDVDMLQLWVPAGFAHGFSVLSDEAIIQYKCDQYYHPESEAGIMWNDSDLAINWKIQLDKAILSPKDQLHPIFNEHLPIGI